MTACKFSYVRVVSCQRCVRVYWNLWRTPLEWKLARALHANIITGKPFQYPVDAVGENIGLFLTSICCFNLYMVWVTLWYAEHRNDTIAPAWHFQCAQRWCGRDVTHYFCSSFAWFFASSWAFLKSATILARYLLISSPTGRGGAASGYSTSLNVMTTIVFTSYRQCKNQTSIKNKLQRTQVIHQRGIRIHDAS